ncbi:MAG TPA: hypothetical protein VE990_07175 [Acidimicrobiales bacterium]|nr:hypothetical protein [Acidimicrobiales bacterium]
MVWRLGVDAVSEALGAFGCAEADVVAFPGGVSGDVFHVRTATSRFVAKFTYGTREGVELGLLVAEAAQAAGLRAAAPVRTTDGELVVMVEGLEMSSWIGPTPLL